MAKDPFDMLGKEAEPTKPKKIVTKEPEAAEESTAKKTTAKKTTAASKRKAKASTTVKKKRRRRRKSTSRAKTQVKKGSQLTAKWFFVGCGVFFLLFLLLMTGGVFWILQSPDTLQSLGLDAASVKTLLYLFSGLFFGILTLGLLFWLFLSIYRLATKKGSKVRFILGLMTSLFMLIGVIVGWVYAINEIRKIQTGPTLSTNLIISYIETRDGRVPAETGIPLIAPMMMNYEINSSSNASIAREIANSIRNKAPYSVQLDCGNGQILPMQNTGRFNGSCLFMEKKQYDFTLLVNRGEGVEEFSANGFIPQAGIEIDPVDDEGRFNDNLDEYIIGVAPVTARYRSELLFTDLNLPDDEILWDFGADGTIDYTNQASFQHTFLENKLHKVAFRLPGMPGTSKISGTEQIDNNDVRYAFDLRVIESELAQCELLKENVRDNRWKFTPLFDEDILVADYRYTIYDLVNEEVLASQKADAKGILNYDLPEGAKYEISMTYFTRDKQKGSCAPIEVNEGYQGNEVVYDLLWKHNADDNFQEVDIKSVEVTRDDEFGISSSLVPTSLQVDVLRTEPDPDAQVELFFNGREIFPEGNNIFEFDITAEGEYEMEFVITTAEGVESRQVTPVVVKRSSVNALIQVNGEFVGNDPYTIELDASVSPLYDEDDEIVFFDWDFGDGEIKRKVSQGIVTHEYTFDAENDRGEFYPTVTVYTRKNEQDTYRLPEPIVVKRAQREVEIFMDSHPQQQARVGETVRMSVRTDGLIDGIERDFGNFKTVSCDSRECSDTSIVYEEPGIYEIKVEVSYEDSIPSVKTLNVQVF